MDPIKEKLLFDCYLTLKNYFEKETDYRPDVTIAQCDFLEYLDKKTIENKINKNHSAYSKIKTAKRKFSFYLKELKMTSLPFMEMTPQLIKGFESYLKDQMLTMNTISFYMRVLRLYYNKAVSDGTILSDTHPFQRVYTGIPKTKKRAVSSDVFIRIQKAALPERLLMSRDIFLFSFYTRGMPFVDIAHLERKNIRVNSIKYFRQKTGQEINITLEPCIVKIINRYKNESGVEYIFPVLSNKGHTTNYFSAIRKYNRQLKEISSILDLDGCISSYVARHSWASIAKQAGVPVNTICECMGHTSEKTTQIYLSSLNQNTLDEANRLVIKTVSNE